MIYLIVAGEYATAQDDVGVTVSINRDTIGLDETALLTVLVSGSVQRLPSPRLPTLPMFEVYSQGQSSNMTVTNGVIEASVTYRYLIIPNKAGSFPITGVSVVVGNKRYKGNSVSLTVLNQGTAAPSSLENRAKSRDGSSKDYFLEASIDNKNPYVNQQVTLTLKFYVAVQYYGSPELVEPTTTGFWTELLGTKAPYHEKLNNRTYKVIERQYALFPTQTGALSIGRASIKFVAASRRQRRDPFDIFGMLGGGKEITVRSQPVKVQVKALPTQGRPAGFTGTIGNFRIDVTTDKREVEVNQPVTVEINIRGVGNVKSAAEPKIDSLPDFRVYRASSNETVSKVDGKIGGTKTFEEVFIPKRPGMLEIPSLSFNYFNPESNKYRTVRTRPIRLQVHKPAGYAAGTDLPYAGPDLTIGAEAREIRYIKTDLGKLQPTGQLLISSPLYLAANCVPVAVLLVTVVIRRRREKLSSDIGFARSRQASKQARKRLTRARTLANISRAGEFFSESNQALLSYIADKLNISPHGLTPDRVAELLSDRNADQQLVNDTIVFLNQCAYARYAAAVTEQEEIDKALKAAEDLMIRMESVKF